jgi:outer membrane protein TolC
MIAPRLASVALAAGVALLTACGIGPKYAVPSAPVPPAYKETGAPNVDGDWKPAQPSDDAARGKWWERFDDPRLNELEEKLDISNQNIAAAAAGVLAARAAIREARAQYFPAVTGAPGITNARLSTGFGKPLGIAYTNYSLPIDASWEPDLWGRIRATVAGASFAAQAGVADLENVRLSAQAELAAICAAPGSATMKRSPRRRPN